MRRGAVMDERGDDAASARNPQVRSYLREVIREGRDDKPSREAELRARARATRAARRGVRPNVKPRRVSIAGFLFWFPKVCALLSVPPAVTVLLMVAKGAPKGYGAAAIWALFAIGWSLRQGLSRRQWVKEDLSTLNQTLAEAARILMWLAVAACVAWAGYTLFVAIPPGAA